MTPLRIAVIGAGLMGRRHLAAAKAAADISIAAVIDSDRQRAEDAARAVGSIAALNIDALNGKIDVAIVAAPTAAHSAIAIPLLRAGIGCLVEKPIANTAAEIDAMIAAASSGKAVLQVGHVERFNPAVETLMAAAIPREAIRVLAARRMSAASARVTDIDVVSDLMVHDIDVVLALKGAGVTSVQAAGNDDHVVALMSFADGAVATLTASRMTATRVRDLDVATSDAFFHLDYVARSVARTQRRGTDQMAAAQLAVPSGDALEAQLADFLRAVRERKTPRVSGEDALRVMQVAWRVQDALRKG